MGARTEGDQQRRPDGRHGVESTSDLTEESGAIALNSWVEEGVGGYRLTIKPSGAPRVISGMAPVGLIVLNGADRVVDAAAVYRLYGGPACIVDFGTATTFDVVSGKGEYLGGLNWYFLKTRNYRLNLQVIDAGEEFFRALQGVIDPEEKRPE
jgi:hypothetical protein